MFDVKPITSPKRYDCGPTCLQMLLAYYGVEVDLDALIKECDVDVDGCTGLDIMRAGRLHGLDMQGWSIDADELVRQDRPAICSWRYNHWVVFAGRDADGRVVICNPDRGRYRLSECTFKALFSGLDDHPGQGVALTNGEPCDLPEEPTEIEIISDALAELSEVASDLAETESVNADAIAELSALVSEIINGGIE